MALGEYLNFAEDIAREAGKHTLSYFRRDIDVEIKSDRSPVTRADRETEQLLRSRIEAAYPDHCVAGEEFGVPETWGEWTWVIDPIDGTQAFVHGVPLYTVLLALLYENKPVIGVIHNPALDETVSAAVGAGAHYNGRVCRVRECNSLSDAEICTTDFISLARDMPSVHQRIVEHAPFGRTWADGYGYLLLATGRIDAMIDPHMSLWDIAPMYPILEEAGGAVSDRSGNRNPLGDSALAAHPKVHGKLLGRP